MLSTWPQHNVRFIKRSSAKSWTRSWLCQSQDSAKLRNLRQRKKEDRIAENLYKTKFYTDANKLKYSSNVSCLIWKNNLRVSNLLNIPKLIKIHATHALKIALLNCWEGSRKPTFTYYLPLKVQQFNMVLILTLLCASLQTEPKL